jgi:hypothetical protein
MALFWTGAMCQIMAESLDVGFIGRRVNSDAQTFMAAQLFASSVIRFQL